MNAMKGFVAGLLLAISLGFQPAHATGVPVIDAAKLTQDQVNQATNVAKYLEMIAQYKAQIDQMKAQYEAISGTRNLGQLLNNPAFASYLPDDWKQVYNSVQSGGYKGLTGGAKALRDASRILDLCKGRSGRDQEICIQQADKGAADKAFATEAYDKANDRWDQIQGLLEQVNYTTDAKSIAELQARINGETASLQNEMIKMQMFQMMASAQDRMDAQARREQTVKNLQEGGYIELKPVEYKKR